MMTTVVMMMVVLVTGQVDILCHTALGPSPRSGRRRWDGRHVFSPGLSFLCRLHLENLVGGAGSPVYFRGVNGDPEE